MAQPYSYRFPPFPPNQITGRELHEATQFLSSTTRHQHPSLSSVNNDLHTFPPLKLARINLDTTHQGTDANNEVARTSSLVDLTTKKKKKKKKSVGKETVAQSNHHRIGDADEEEEEERERDPIDRLRAVSEGLRRLRCDLESRLEDQCYSNNNG